MKILLYFEGEKLLSKSGIGRALSHQKRALSIEKIAFTMDKNCDDYDILHINTYGPNSIRVINKARKLDKKVVYHAHSTEEDFRNSFIGSNQIAPLVKKYLTYLYKKADYLITPTPYSKKLLKSYGIDVPIKAVSNGIDLEKYSPDPKKEQQFKDYFKIKENQKIIICVGLYFERKGLLDFIEVAKRLPDYRFIWFGYTPLYSIPAKIRKIVQGDHPANVEFPGYIKGDIIEGAYSAADIFFFPSHEETEGIVVLEALASHQNVVVRNIPVYEGWLENGVNCYMCDSVEDFSDTIRDLVNQRLVSTSDNGYELAQTKSINEIGVELGTIYKSLM